MHPWTDRKIRVHAFYCMLGIPLPQYVHRQAQTAWDGIPVEQLLEKGRIGFPRCFPSRPLVQQPLAGVLGLDQLGKYPKNR
jgi:hypothetical protein